MSISPFMAPSGRRRSREAARRRRRQRRRILIGIALVVAIAVAVTLIHPWRTHASAAAPHRAREAGAHAHLARNAPTSQGAAPTSQGLAGTAHLALSPPACRWARPPLTLDLADPHADQIHLAFHEPPRAGLLFNLDTGRVLWQLHPLARLRIASLTKMMTALLTVRSSPPHAPVLDHPPGRGDERLEGRGASARAPRAAGDAALRAAAALRQRRRDRARPARRPEPCTASWAR